METILLNAFVDNANPEGCNQYKDCGGSGSIDKVPMHEIESVAKDYSKADAVASKYKLDKMVVLAAAGKINQRKAHDDDERELAREDRQLGRNCEHLETILLNALTGNYRRETVNGREFIVAPLVSIVPGVLNGSKGALFYPEDEISRDPQAWNGMPLVKGHPTRNGQHVSGRDPWVRANLQMGVIYNSVYNGRLQHEAWFDVEDTKRVDNWVYQQLVANKPIEVSTGLFTDNEPTQGTYNNKPYDYVARNYRPDHMAILVGQRGACSNDDGCGVNVNEDTPTTNHIEKLKDGKYRLLSHEGKNLGTFDTEAEAQKHEEQVNYFKTHNAEQKRSVWAKLGELLGLVDNAGMYGNPQSLVTGKFKPHGAGTGKGDVHEAAQRATIDLTDEDRARGELCKSDLINGGHNPASWVADEDTWEKAKAAADKGDYGDDSYWAVVSHIYKKMGGEVKEATPPAANSRAEDLRDCQEECDDMDCVDECLDEFIGNEMTTLNAFCATGSGGGVDPSCGAGGGGGKSSSSQQAVDATQKAVKVSEKASSSGHYSDHERAALAHTEAGNAHTKAAEEHMKAGNRDRAVKHIEYALKHAKHATSHAIAGSKNAVEVAKSAMSNNTEDIEMNRIQAIDHLTTNCDCWKGKQEVLANRDSFTDEDIQRLLKAFNARKLAVNTLRDIGVAVSAPSTLTVNDMPAFIKAKMGKKEDDAEDTADGGDDEEMEGEPPVKNKTTTKNAKKPAPITERLSPDELEVWNNAVKITANEKKKIVAQLVANLEGDYRKEKYKKLMGKNMDDLREMLELRGYTSNQDESDYAPVTNGIGAFFTPDFDDSVSTRTTDNAEEDGPPLGLPSSSYAASK